MKDAIRSLDSYLRQGFNMLPHLRERITVEELEANKAPQACIDLARKGLLKAALLIGPNGEKVLYPLLDEENTQRAAKEMAQLHRNRWVTIMLMLHVSYLQTGDITHFSLENLIEALQKQLEWEIGPSPFGS